MMNPEQRAVQEHNADMYLDALQDELEEARHDLADAEARKDWAAVAEWNGYIASLEEMVHDAMED